MPSDSLTLFGVGDGWPCPDRNHSATLYRLGQTSILLDCGEPISSSFAASGLSHNAVDHIVLSHMHADHVAGFPMLLQGFWLRNRTKPLTVHLPREGIDPLRRLLRSGYLFEQLFRFRLRFKPLVPARKLRLGAVTVTPYGTTHLADLKERFQGRHPHPFQAFGFILANKRVRIAHSADLGKPEDLEPLLRKPLDLLVCELAHFEPRDVFAYLRGRSIRKVVFTHLPDRLWRQRVRLARQASKALPGMRVAIGRDLQQIRL